MGKRQEQPTATEIATALAFTVPQFPMRNQTLVAVPARAGTTGSRINTSTDTGWHALCDAVPCSTVRCYPSTLF